MATAHNDWWDGKDKYTSFQQEQKTTARKISGPLKKMNNICNKTMIR